MSTSKKEEPTKDDYCSCLTCKVLRAGGHLNFGGSTDTPPLTPRTSPTPEVKP